MPERLEPDFVVNEIKIIILTPLYRLATLLICPNASSRLSQAFASASSNVSCSFKRNARSSTKRLD
jgi:hypothetical protein